MKKLTENRLAKEKKSDMISLIQRGYSLMAKLQPSKLIMRVRFPLPAVTHYAPPQRGGAVVYRHLTVQMQRNRRK